MDGDGPPRRHREALIRTLTLEAYQGPSCSPQVMPFFNSMGFALPERKGIADFLQEVTSPKDQEQYWCVAFRCSSVPEPSCVGPLQGSHAA